MAPKELILMARIPRHTRWAVRVLARLAAWRLIDRSDARLICDWLIWKTMEVKTLER